MTSLPKSVFLTNSVLNVEIAPDLGGSILKLEKFIPTGTEPILKPWEGRRENPVDRGMFVMLPWCNRISGVGLPWNETVYPLPCMVPGQHLPIHGTALHKSWRILDRSSLQVLLELTDHSVKPFDFHTTLSYTLADASLTVKLKIRHLGQTKAPYGIGLHPWFACDAGDQIQFNASHIAREDIQNLPTELIELKNAPDLDFRRPRSLPQTLLNGTYIGWDGHATIHRQRRSQINISTKGNLGGLHVFSRSDKCGFVCLEPVSHTVDSPHRPLTEDMAMKALSTGQTMSTSITISV